MLAARPASYQNTHAKRQNYDKLQAQLRDAENIHPDKLLTDRSTYIGYLESQLERVTNACLTVQSFDQRIETVASAARLLEEKVLNTGRLLKCSQSYSEENDGLQKQAVAELARRMQQLESAVSSANQHQLQWEAAQDSALQGRLDALEQRMLSKMDKALAKFLEKQLGVGPGGQPVVLPDMDRRLGQLEQSVGLLLAGTPLPADLQRAAACTQYLEAMQGVVQQEVKGLKVERSNFRDLVHDAKWAASQGAAPDQAPAQQMLDGIQCKVDGEIKRGMDCLGQAKAELQSLAQGLQSSHRHRAAATPGSAVQLATKHQIPAEPQQQQQQQQQQEARGFDLKGAPDHALQGREEEGNERARLRSATQDAEQGLQYHSQRVQSQMQSMQDTFQSVCQSLQSLQAAFQQPQAPAVQPRAAAGQPRHKEAVLSSPKQSHGDVRRASSRCPPDSPSAAGTPQKRSLRKTASTLSPRREQEKGHAAKRQWVPGGSFKEKDRPTPVKLTSSKPEGNAPDAHLPQRTIKRRQRLQELYAELQALGD